jgi:hypothetical protein
VTLLQKRAASYAALFFAAAAGLPYVVVGGFVLSKRARDSLVAA